LLLAAVAMAVLAFRKLRTKMGALDQMVLILKPLALPLLVAVLVLATNFPVVTEVLGAVEVATTQLALSVSGLLAKAVTGVIKITGLEVVVVALVALVAIRPQVVMAVMVWLGFIAQLTLVGAAAVVVILP
jgi:hypothetical protein